MKETDIDTYLVGDYRRPEHLEEILTSVELGTKLHAFQMVRDHLHKMSLLGVFKRRKLISVMLTSNTNTQMVGDHHHLHKMTLLGFPQKLKKKKTLVSTG